MQLLCTPAAAAEALGISKRTVFEMLADGRLSRKRIPGVRGSRVLVGELERIAKGADPQARLSEPINQPQIAAYKAKCRHYASLTEQSESEVRKQILAWCSRRFGREITSSKDMSWQEAHDMLDELESWAEGTDE